MTTSLLPRYEWYSRRFSRASAIIAMAVAVTVFVGWSLDLPVLKSGIPGLVAMNPMTAIGFLLGGFAVIFLDRARAPGVHRIAVRCLAIAIIVIPLLCLSRLYLPVDLGPDRLLFPASVAIPVDGFVNRMAPMTGVSFVLVGVSLLLSTWSGRVVSRVASASATLAALIALIVIVDYGYSLRSLSAVGGLIPVAPNTAVAFLILACGILSARPASGLVALFVSDRIGGVLARRLLPAAVVIPLVMGWLELQGQDRHWYDASGGAAIVAIATVLVLAVLICFSVIAVDRSDEARVRAEAGLRDLNQNLERRVEERTRETERVNRELMQEVAGRREAQEELRRAADELRGWFEASPLAMCSLALDTTVLSWNRAAETLFGWEARDVIGKKLPILSPEMQAQSDALKVQVQSGKLITNVEVKRLRKDGKLVDVSLSTAALRDAEGKTRGVVALYADMTDRRQLELQLRQAQKMEAIGRLAGGVAHDFNNILTVIQSAASFLLTDLGPDSPSRTDAEDITNAAQRAARLTRQLLALSRQQVFELRILDINNVVRPLEPMLRRLLEANIDMSLHLAAGLDAVKADPNQLDLVLLNLVVNARDAMPNGGKILIETSNVDLDDEYPRGHLNAGTGPHVLLSVTDTGIGMDAETQARIFEPFFTTKGLGVGTGLGLATVYGIVKQLGGHIWVYSEVGHGTTFKIYLPRHAGSEVLDAAPAAHAAPVRTLGARILLVEDDAAVRNSVQRLLLRHQYVVIDVASGDAALDHIAGDHQVDLVMSDMMMSGMTGLELRERLREMGYTVPVLLMSGYSEEAIARMGGVEAIKPYVEKPFTIDRVLPKIEELLYAARQTPD